MTSLLEKLVLTGFGKMQVVNFSIQEMILPQVDGVTRIIYEWNQLFGNRQDLSVEEYFPYIRLLCSINDKRQNVHFISQGLMKENFVGQNSDVFSAKDTNDLLFMSDQDICLTFGRYMNQLDTGANVGLIPNGFNRPLALNDLNTLPRTGVRNSIAGNPTYNYSTESNLPLPDFKDQMGYATTGAEVADNGDFTAVVKYVEVGMPIDELKQLILGL